MYKAFNQVVKINKFPFLNLGFRPFFFAAGLFAVVASILWFLFYASYSSMEMHEITPVQWHAHEMIYGYSAAVIAGFVLTAAKNWTGVQTLHGWALFCLFALWIGARVSLLFGGLVEAAVFDILFFLLLTVATVYPIVISKSWGQLAVVTKIAFLAISNTLFYLGSLGMVEGGVFLGVYGGFYLIIGLIMMMGRRVIPFFIELGVDRPIKVRNSNVSDGLSLVLFIMFFILEITQQYPLISGYIALSLFAVNTVRLLGWYSHQIWHKPLLWSLFLAIAFICLGFFLHFVHRTFSLSPYIAIHAFAWGIGMITLSMMARVSLGHTARNIHQVPKFMPYAFALLGVGLMFRLLLCVVWPSYYVVWIGISALCWAGAFLVFTVHYAPMFFQKRLDGQFG